MSFRCTYKTETHRPTNSQNETGQMQKITSHQLPNVPARPCARVHTKSHMHEHSHTHAHTHTQPLRHTHAVTHTHIHTQVRASEPHVRASEPHLVSGRARTRARWCMPPRTVSLQPYDDKFTFTNRFYTDLSRANWRIS